MASADVFCRAVSLEAFQPFADAETALANANAVSEGLFGFFVDANENF